MHSEVVTLTANLEQGFKKSAHSITCAVAKIAI